MTETKLQHLEDLDFEWNTKDAGWNQRFAELEKYFHENGNCSVSRKIPKLGRWVDHQRNSKHHRAGHTEERKAKLRKLGSFGY